MSLSMGALAPDTRIFSRGLSVRLCSNAHNDCRSAANTSVRRSLMAKADAEPLRGANVCTAVVVQRVATQYALRHPRAIA